MAEELIPRVKLLQVAGGDADFLPGDYGAANAKLREIVAHVKELGGWVHAITFVGALETKPGYHRIRVVGYYYKPMTLQEVAAEAKDWEL